MKWLNPRINKKSVFINLSTNYLNFGFIKIQFDFFMKSILKLTENEVKEGKE